jgi:hypothetical protein
MSKVQVQIPIEQLDHSTWYEFASIQGRIGSAMGEFGMVLGTILRVFYPTGNGYIQVLVGPPVSPVTVYVEKGTIIEVRKELDA